MTKKQINDELVKELEGKIKTLEDKREGLFKKRKPIDAQISKASNKLEELIAQRDQLLVDGIDSKHPDWDFLLATDWRGSLIKSKALDFLLEPMGLKHSGYFEKTQQVCIDIVLNYQQKVDKALSGLRTLMPHIKPIDNVFAFGVFESTLSASGVYELLVSKEGEKCRLVKTTYGHTDDIAKFDTLKDALIYIAEHHWCTGGPNTKDC